MEPSHLTVARMAQRNLLTKIKAHLPSRRRRIRRMTANTMLKLTLCTPRKKVMSEKRRKINMDEYAPICMHQAVRSPGTMSVSKVSYKYDQLYWESQQYSQWFLLIERTHAERVYLELSSPSSDGAHQGGAFIQSNIQIFHIKRNQIDNIISSFLHQSGTTYYITWPTYYHSIDPINQSNIKLRNL